MLQWYNGHKCGLSVNVHLMSYVHDVHIDPHVNVNIFKAVSYYVFYNLTVQFSKTAALKV